MGCPVYPWSPVYPQSPVYLRSPVSYVSLGSPGSSRPAGVKSARKIAYSGTYMVGQRRYLQVFLKRCCTKTHISEDIVKEMANTVLLIMM